MPALMIASLAVLVLLSQEPPPPSPPPMLPADGAEVPPPPDTLPPPAPRQQPDAPLRAAPTTPRYAEPKDLEPTRAEIQEADKPSAAARIGGSIGAAAVGAALTTGGEAWVGGSRCIGSCVAGGGGANAVLGLLFAGAGVTLVALGAWGAHRLLGGKSSPGWAFLGAATGAIIGLVGTLLIEAAANPTGNFTFPVWGYSVIASGLGAVAAGLMPELGNYLSVREQSVAHASRF